MRLLLPLAAAALTTRGGGPLRVLGSTSRQDAGRYQARFDVRAFPSGVYLYRLITDTGVGRAG